MSGSNRRTTTAAPARSSTTTTSTTSTSTSSSTTTTSSQSRVAAPRATAAPAASGSGGRATASGAATSAASSGEEKTFSASHWATGTTVQKYATVGRPQTTVLAIVPSPTDSSFAAIQSVRSQVDPDCALWPPHVPLLCPFMPAESLKQASDFLCGKLSQITPFTIHLRNFNYVEVDPATEEWEIFLIPEAKPFGALSRLRKIVFDAFPQCAAKIRDPDSPPTVTIGRMSKSKLKTFILDFEMAWKPVTFTVNDLVTLSRNPDGQFSIATTIPLGSVTLTPPPSTASSKPLSAEDIQHSSAGTKGFSAEMAIEQLQVDSSDASTIDATLTVSLTTPPPAEKKTLLLLVVDRSGSMKPAWRQVQNALLYILEESESDPNVIIEVILYSSTASRFSWTAQNREREIENLTPGGLTCFASAFDCCQDVIKQTTRTHGDLDIVIGFMTDGTHTTKRNAFQSYTSLRLYLHALPNCTATVHCVGFTESHRFEDLDRLRRELGTQPGGFLFADDSDGKHGLQQKLEAIFDVATLYGGQLSITLNIPGFLFCNENGPPTDCATVKTNIDRGGKATFVQTLKKTAELPAQVNGKIAIRKEGSDRIQAQLECPVTMTALDGDSSIVLSSLYGISLQVDALFGKIGAHKEPPSDPEIRQYNSSLQGVLTSLRRWQDSKDIFQLPRVQRAQVMDLMSSQRLRIARMLDLLATWARGVWSSATKARLADIAFAGTFKSNRRRRMDRRISKNAMVLKKDQEVLEQHVVDQTTFGDASEESVSLFSCILSLSDWRDLLRDKDMCGFGLAVSRPEWVVDDPTQIRVNAISCTYLAKSAIEEAIRCQIDIQGHLKTTGGFGVGSEMGVAVRGRGREPINSWLPLYIHQEHWKVVRILLKQSIGYYVSLDPLGFTPEQVDAIFLVLGTMAARLGHPCGEHPLKLLIQFQRTCLAIAQEFNWLPIIESRITRFLSICPYETRDQIKNIMSAIGYLLVLPRPSLEKLFPSETEWNHFWINAVSLAVRRSAFTIFRSASDEVVMGVLEKILLGNYATDINLSDLENLLTKQEDAAADEEFIDCTMKKPTHETVGKAYPTFSAESFSEASIPTIVRVLQQVERQGYPTISSLHSALVYSSWWLGRMRGSTPSPTTNLLLEEVDKNWGIAPQPWIVSVKEAFASTLAACGACPSKSLLHYLQTLSPTTFFSKTVSPCARLNLIRAIVGNGIRYRVNKPARECIDEGWFMDTFADPARCLSVLADEIVNVQIRARQALQRLMAFENDTLHAIVSTDMEVFVTWVKTTCGRSSRYTMHFPMIINKICNMNRSERNAIAPKIRYIITGKKIAVVNNKVNYVNDLDKGALWLPSRKKNNMFADLLGDPEYRIILILSLYDHYLDEHNNRVSEVDDEEANPDSS